MDGVTPVARELVDIRASDKPITASTRTPETIHATVALCKRLGGPLLDGGGGGGGDQPVGP